MKKRLVLIGSLAIAGVLFFGHGAYMLAKAQLAQYLLERAWARTIHGERDVKPWRWADTWPVARIEFPHQRQSYIVLAGASGRTMAFGPGHVDGSASPDAAGNCVISAHRDTQFAVLRDVEVGDPIVLQTRDGHAIRYRVLQHRVVEKNDLSLLEPSRGRILTLITCFPFDAIRPGGPQRYVVIASAVGSGS
ncbi:MAG TPA: class GN sortase [Thermoanaerobaculia bacterium]|nr:class GN sortase [Thermoanaerobaculia bacterium]